MLIWVALDVDNQLLDIKKKAKEVESLVNFCNSNIYLPLHISLKISFYVEEDMIDNVVEDITNTVQELRGTEVKLERLELHESISWIKVCENEIVQNMHDKLDVMLKEKYNIPQHEYDKNFKLHVSLFIDNEVEKVKQAFLMMKDFELPEKLIIDRFVIGCSPDGSVGSYKVIKNF